MMMILTQHAGRELIVRLLLLPDDGLRGNPDKAVAGEPHFPGPLHDVASLLPRGVQQDDPRLGQSQLTQVVPGLHRHLGLDCEAGNSEIHKLFDLSLFFVKLYTFTCVMKEGHFLVSPKCTQMHASFRTSKFRKEALEIG